MYTELSYSTSRLSLDRPFALIHILYRAPCTSVVVHWLKRS